ncbi:type IV pilus modification PilV family protein [Deinococcus roseus]|uniref:Prepilin-type N-terminal cleavage/methylation domain-containing protein n=1 Tax=Deinococcus roseus TaxID=392414 RepID=A0ABQ2DHU0_9DEIO|nr:prepilin-type N-terminal cleavage/methylation domain-containing protein [Deinococcus roseus]GGJ56764.1 hypothetical protein GCM10008938_48650 [Deinococcus roseus]
MDRFSKTPSKQQDSREAGFTLVEVLFAFSLLLILMVATSNLAVSTYQSDFQVGQRNQMNQIVMGMGRRILAGDSLVLPASGQTSRTFTASGLQGMGFQNTTNLTAVVTATTNVTYSSNTYLQYQIRVCWKTRTCVTTYMAAPEGT